MSLTKTLSIAAAAALGMAATAAPAMAQFPPNTTPTISGSLTLSQSITISCDVSVDLSVNGAGVVTVTGRSFSPGSFLCGGVVAPSGTWTVAYGPGTDEVTVSVGASSILGSCFDTVVADFDNATNTLDFDNVTVSGTPSDCTVDGSLS